MITGFVIIRNHALILDGEKVFSGGKDLDEFLAKSYDKLQVDYPKFHRMDKLAKAGFVAAELLIRSHPIPKIAAETAVILSNSNSSLDTDLRYLESAKKNSSPALFVYTLPNIVAGEICIRHSIKGENTFFVAEKFDAGMLSDYVSMVLRSGSARACIAGWVDVIGEHHDVLLYLIEKEKADAAVEDAKRLEAIYKKDYGTTDREP